MKTKKLLSMLLAVALIASFVSIPAFAEDPAPEPAPAAFDHGIDYTDPNASYDIVPTSTTTVPAGMKIDLLAEKLYVPEGTTIAAYSTDGGNKWTAKAIGSADGADIAKLLDKGCTLLLTNALDSKTKKPVAAKAASGDTPAVEAAVVYTFPKIEVRPKLDKLVINYAVAADNTGKTAGQWVLSVKDGTAAVKDQKIGSQNIPLQVAPAASDKKNPEPTTDGKTWGYFPAAGGINVKPLGEDGKTPKTVYLVRTAPVPTGAITPASKPAKITAQGLQKETKFKADYKKEVLKLKENSVVFFGNKTALDASTADPTVYSAAATTDPAGTLTKAFDKDGAKAGVNLAPYLTEAVTSLCVFTAATAKKPASSIQKYDLAARAYLLNSILSPSNGKLKVEKAYEMLNVEKGKWGGLPKVTGATGSKPVEIRLKATAQGGKETDGKYAASRAGKLHIGWGKYNPTAKSPKDGVISAEIEAPEYPGALTLRPDLASQTVTFPAAPDTITFDISGLVEGGVSLAGILFTPKAEPEGIVKFGLVACDGSKVTVAFDSATPVLDAGTVTITLSLPDSFFDTNTEYLKDYFYCAPAVVTVEPLSVEMPTPTGTGTATVADLDAAATYVFTFSDAAVKALLSDAAGDGKIYVTNNAITGATVGYAVDAAAGTITATVTPTASNAASQKLTFTLNVGKDVKGVALGSKATFDATITKITAP